MFSSKKTLWTMAFAAAILVLAPGTGFCVEEDLYIYRLLFGRVYFEYETGTSEDNGYSREHNRFVQSYSLDTLGNILSRRLITYDAGVNFTSNNYQQESTTIDTDTVNYYLKTILLPKSNIPLSLYGSQMNETLSTNTTDSDRTRRILGLNWMMRFRTLPDTRIQIEQQNDSTQSSDTSTMMYNVTMTKTIGPTDNSLYFTMNTNTDNVQDNRDSQSTSINMTNKTRLSRSTIFDMGLSRGDTSYEAVSNPDLTVNAMTIGLQSTPSEEFHQEHRYTFYNNDIDGTTSENGTYTGNMSYKFTDRLNSTLNLTTGQSSSKTPDKEETTDSLGFGFNINYRLSRKLSLSELVSYSKFDTTAETETNVDRELLRALTTLSYFDQLSWARLSTTASLGYNKDKTTEELSGTGIEQGLSAALTNIDFNRYAIFNTSAYWNKVYNLTGDVWSDNKSFQMSAASKLWRRYALLTANYSQSSQASWISASESTSMEWEFNAASNYFRNTKIEASTKHRETFDTVTGDVEVDIDMFSITHNRYLAGGQLDMGFTYNINSNKFEDGSDRFTSLALFAKYNRKLLYDLDWTAYASISRGNGDNETFRNITSLSNLLTYHLRSWLVTGEQKYLQTQDQNRDLIENTFIFRATRLFTWILG